MEVRVHYMDGYLVSTITNCTATVRAHNYTCGYRWLQRTALPSPRIYGLFLCFRINTQTKGE